MEYVRFIYIPVFLEFCKGSVQLSNFA